MNALRQPKLLAEEHRRRAEDAGSAHSMGAERKHLNVVKAREDQATETDIHEVIDRARCPNEMRKLGDRRQHQQQDSRNALADLDRFCHQVTQGLNALTFEGRQQLLRHAAARATVQNGRVRIETAIAKSQGNLFSRSS